MENYPKIKGNLPLSKTGEVLHGTSLKPKRFYPISKNTT